MANSTVVTETKGQFRITVPISIIRAMRISRGDYLNWTVMSANSTSLTKMVKLSAIHKGVRK